MLRLNLLHNIKMVFLIPDEPVPPHEGQLVGKRAAFYAEIIRQLLAIVGNIKGIATGALDALREVGQQPLSNGLGSGVQHPAGELQIFLRAERQQVPHKPYMARALHFQTPAGESGFAAPAAAERAAQHRAPARLS